MEMDCEVAREKGAEYINGVILEKGVDIRVEPGSSLRKIRRLNRINKKDITFSQINRQIMFNQ